MKYRWGTTLKPPTSCIRGTVVLKRKKLLHCVFVALICFPLLFAPTLLFVSPAFAGPAVTEPDNPAQAEKERQAQREFEREERARKEIEKERGSGEEHTRRMAEDFAKGTIEGILGFSPLETVTGTAGIKKVISECFTGCHAPEVVQKLKMITDRLGTSGQDQRDRKKLEKRMQELRLLDKSVVLRTGFRFKPGGIGTEGGPGKSPV
ncbi:MAG: hypothetical protein RLZZ171_2438 [Cyanobacteriota bacterium]